MPDGDDCLADLVSPSRTYGLVDILDRVLDKGLVVVGDIKINLANVELLTIQIRLLICSIDKAEQIGMNWWRHDPRLIGRASLAAPHWQRLIGAPHRGRILLSCNLSCSTAFGSAL